MPESGTDLRSFSFVLAVPNLERSASYFRHALGFHLEWPEGSGWQLASRGGVRIMMGHCPDAMAPSATGDHSYFGYFNVDDVDALHDEFVSRGAIILQPPADKPHGMREFLVGTPDGHRMMIGRISHDHEFEPGKHATIVKPNTALCEGRANHLCFLHATLRVRMQAPIR